ncbi:MAG TPA: 16S rRNA (cytosine(1402)-N(4))-methyltransferase RsmH [Balneolaceae bacterium]|nr:16S rRNA (cytosine(1402)-N(4))-methyltransferase RsmH [Balneolaceae bacterium]
MTSHETTYYSHTPVLLYESTTQLVTNPAGIYIDATLGGGGHAAEILSRLNKNGRLIGIDQDDEALAAARSNIGTDPRFSTIKGNFGYLSRLVPPELHGKISGILLDLGVSTHQIKESERGFSFQKDGPLDMRMGNLRGLTAYQIVNNYSYEDLRDVIFHYGEEKLSRQIADAIINERPIETTMQLRKVIESVVHGPHQIKSVARVFQGIRIAVNGELDMLRAVLEQGLEIMEIGGHFVAISYHSLEDRIVKRFFKAGNHTGQVKKDFYGHEISPIRSLSNGIIRPSEDEIEKNSAARSAKMRVAEKIKEV